DSLYTGTKYGLFDLDRIIYTIKPFKDNDSYCCAVDRKGCEAVEGYLFCRYFMHWQVYLHKTVRSYETLLRVILQRARLIYKQAPYAIMIPRNLNFLFENKGDKLDQNFLENYLNIDDFDFYHTLKLWANGNDKILTDLCNRFLYRHPFKTFDDPGKDKVERIREYIEKQEGGDAQWYFHIDTPQNQGYDIYQPGSSKAPIRILDYPPNSWQEISRASRTKAIEALSEPVSRRLIMIPRDHYESIKSWL
ncbi:hypothetical protein IJT10_02020, partial [bacterium]|nr:hypothetical protein [bacterium]